MTLKSRPRFIVYIMCPFTQGTNLSTLLIFSRKACDLEEKVGKIAIVLSINWQPFRTIKGLRSSYSILTPSHAPVTFDRNNYKRFREKCKILFSWFKMAAISQGQGQLGSSPIPQGAYPKVCLCEVLMDSVQWWPRKFLYKDSSSGVCSFNQVMIKHNVIQVPVSCGTYNLDHL